MELDESDEQRLKLFLGANGFFLKKLNLQNGCDQSTVEHDHQQSSTYIWQKTANAEIEIDNLNLSDKLEQIGTFEVDLTNGSDADFVENVFSRATDLEPIWGNGMITDPADNLLPEQYRLRVTEKIFYPHDTGDNSGYVNFTILRDRYAICTDSKGDIFLVDLARLGPHTQSLKDKLRLRAGDFFCDLSEDVRLTLLERLPSFMGLPALLLGDSTGRVVIYKETSAISHFYGKPENPVLRLQFSWSVTKVATCDYIDLLSNLTIFTHDNALAVVFFNSKESIPNVKNVIFPNTISNISFLSCTAAGYTAICQDETGHKYSIHFPILPLLNGTIQHELLDYSAEPFGHSKNNSSSHMVVSKDDFLSVPRFEFLTLSYNAGRNERDVNRIYQTSMIFESLPLYPSESNNLGFGASIAQVEVPTPNFALLYENIESFSESPIQLRYTTYQKYGRCYERIYVNKKLAKEVSEDPDFYISKRSHGAGDSKIYNVDQSSELPDLRLTRSDWKAVPYLHPTSHKSARDSLSILRNQLEELRSQRKGHSSLDLCTIDNFELSSKHLLQNHFFKAWKFCNIESSILQKEESLTLNFKQSFPFRKFEIAPIGGIGLPVVDDYVNKSILKYLRINDATRFDNDGPKFNSRASGDDFLLSVNSELRVQLFSADPMISNAFTTPVFPCNLNCVDLHSDFVMISLLKEISCIVVASGSGIVFLYRLTEWRGIYAFRFEKILNTIKIQDVCNVSDDEERLDFCEAKRRFASHDSTFQNSCNKCRIVIKHPTINSMDYTHDPATDVVSLYINTMEGLVVYEIAPNNAIH
ncbi:unnamed protein product [Kluyveromyces dobzhanskii CBS 2104]|uniref:WGS project CCBQ000000000 data, contig MAT n=1 Tax=Kluyveromyces dobzhanskii CBS 2104 TaxID=1427455 RepID=A0A0A8L3R2_9SACH|nr:unnamed protein product [Kluyveromyces dobzhanskii CBS 2104]